MDSDPPIRVLLVEDHALFRRGLRRLLEAHDLEVVGEAPNGEAGARLAAELRPDVIVMDLHMPIMGGVEATRSITERGDRSRILVLTISVADADVLDAVRAGAAGYLLKDAEPDAIVAGIRQAANGGVTIAPEVAGALVERVRAEEPPVESVEGPALTDRELEVLRLLVDGCENAEIASRLFVSPSTVKHHVSAILDKLGVTSRVQAAVHAVRAGLV